MAETQSRQTKRLPPQETHKSAPDDDNFDDLELDQIFETPHLTAHGKTLAMRREALCIPLSTPRNWEGWGDSIRADFASLRAVGFKLPIMDDFERQFASKQ